MPAEVTAFAQRLSSAVSIDWKSGEVAFNETSIRAAAESLQRSTAYAVGHAFAYNLIANLRSGFVPRLFMGRIISPGSRDAYFRLPAGGVQCPQNSRPKDQES